MMRMAAAVSLALLAGCVGAAPDAPAQALAAMPLRVTNNGQPFAFDQGAAAQKVAQAACLETGKSLRTSIYDRFDRATGEWVYPEGCA
jgi:hypothetical protein